jgi:uncharacterized membrane-anchored protein YhcB (DUF1043 family)
MYIVIGILVALTIFRLYGRAKRVEKYTRDELQEDLDELLTELEKDGVLSREILDVPA